MQPIFIRPLTEPERAHIEARLRSGSAFVLRRCQILLASARGERAIAIARQLGCDDQTVRNVIKDFNEQGLDVLKKESCRPHRLRTSIADENLPVLRDLLHRSPRDFGIARNLWSLPLVAQICLSQGLVAAPTTAASVRRALKRLGVSWKRARALDHQPRSAVCTKKKARDRLIAYAQPRSDWAIGFLDEVWWSRFALPRLYAWQDSEHPVRLVEQSWQKNDPDPKALACYGVLWQKGTTEEPVREQMWLRFVTGRPVSEITIQFLDWCCQQLAAQGKRQWLLIWDNASWHESRESAHLDQKTQPRGQTNGRRGTDFAFPTAHQKSLAQSN
ncbi:helix-turn-helix domain-containing protein [Ktedonobacter racemifer]|uniref:Transposase n=1 Tax=Ktedonobacter racemifer DSM 44963 TaxID=485913 RepID=D6U2M9_KTERA|nr:helix-turn-helix domain-containing protein [Ktedonobacter racemifer]EFH80993.1 hypothetical protein Krac_1646 [Ktedonobacter racemifer DSM 44963]